MNDLQIFSNPEFGSIRTLDEDGKVLFCASDVAKALGYSRPSDAVTQHCRYTVKCRIPHPQSPDKTIEMSFIPEGDVYRLITHSNLPDAEKFEHWLFDDMLPTLRKTGSYSIVQADPNLPPELALANQTLAAVNKIYRMQLSQGERLDKLEATKTLDHSQQLAIEEAKSQRVVKLLGGKTSPAYREMSRRVFMACGHDLKLLFDVSSYRDIPIVRFDDAKAYISAWMPKPDMLNEIQQTNGQTSLFDRNCAPAGRLVDAREAAARG